jgi:predicted RND superfamily exporter protein
MGLLLTGSVLLMIIATLAIFPALLSYWKQPEPSGPLMEPETGKED